MFIAGTTNTYVIQENSLLSQTKQHNSQRNVKAKQIKKFQNKKNY